MSLLLATHRAMQRVAVNLPARAYHVLWPPHSHLAKTDSLTSEQIRAQAVSRAKVSIISSTYQDFRRAYSSVQAPESISQVPRTIRTKASINTQGQASAHLQVKDHALFLGNTKIPNIWLRDNCQCSSCIHATTRQRLLDTFSIPHDVSIKTSTVEKDGVKIEWNDGHHSEFTTPFLASATSSPGEKSIVRQGLTDLELWGSSVSGSPPKTSFNNGRPDDMTSLLRNIRQYGFTYVDMAEADKLSPEQLLEATETLLKSIAFIRETHYGGFYDFTADLASADTAYTNIALEAHTDNTYFSDPAGLQAFHLISHTDGEGGASLLVDGFKVAQELQDLDPTAYEILSTVNVNAHASGNDGISIQPYRGFPVFEHDPSAGHLLRVRWNSSDRAEIELPISRVTEWYDAARKLDQLLKKKENEYWEQLVPGRVLIFDNWRVMHGRSSFTGKRRIAGAYTNRDDWISNFKIRNFGQDKVLGKIGV